MVIAHVAGAGEWVGGNREKERALDVIYIAPNDILQLHLV